MSQLNTINTIAFLKYPALLLTLGFSLISIIRNYQWNIRNTVLFILLSVIPVYLRLKYDNNVLVTIWLMYAAYNIPFSHIARKCIQAVLVVFVIVLLALMLGVVNDRLYDHDVQGASHTIAHDLGFSYYGFYAYPAMGLIVCLLYLWQYKLNLLRVLFVLSLSYCFYIFSTTRLQLYTCIGFFVLVLLIRRVPDKLLNLKVWQYVGFVLYPLLCYIIYYVSSDELLAYALENFSDINQITSGRLGLNQEAFRRYDVTLWGNNLEIIADPTASNYFFIDSGYLSVLLGSGLVFCCILLLIHSVLCYKLYKSKAFFLYFCMLLYAFLNLINGFMDYIFGSPALLLASSTISVIKDDLKQLKK